MRLFVLLTAMALGSFSWSGVVRVGESLPMVELYGGSGLLEYHTGELEYREWTSADLVGRAHLLYIVAARIGADKLNQPLLDRLKQEGGVEAFPDEKVRVVSILNTDDAFPMTGALARKSFELARTLPENEHADFVLDERSAIQKAWGLGRKSGAVILLDRQGSVVKFKDGALNRSEIQEFVSALYDLMNSGA